MNPAFVIYPPRTSPTLEEQAVSLSSRFPFGIVKMMEMAAILQIV